MQKIACNKLHM